MRTAMIIPASDEEGAIARVVNDFARARSSDGTPVLEEIVVVNNRSSDHTADEARAAGATVVFEPVRGYGSACLRGIAYLRERKSGPPDVVVFADGDGSNDPRDLLGLIGPIDRGESDLVIGSRNHGADRGSLTPPQRIGNDIAVRALNKLYGVEYNDLGPFRAIAWPVLEELAMEDRDYGWTIEMQIKAAKLGLRVREIDVANHGRIAGKSKVSGTVMGVLGAGGKIVRTLLKYR